ncbi:MAG: endolytic transglycosylase MltG [bacterium]|nr:endolytic transglycosylase MltG [bacterium]
MKKILMIIILVLPLLVLYQLYIPVDRSSTTNKRVDIKKGMALIEITRILKDEGLIRDGLSFELLADVKGATRKIQAGEYLLSPSMNAAQILKILEKGESEKSCFTIPEGYNLFQIADLLSAKGFIHKERFLFLVKDKGFLESLGIQAESAEGYLFPETYCISKGASCEEIIKMMVSELNKSLPQEQTTLSISQLLTLASIIEKETGQTEEKHLISACFHNRLKAGIPLCSCPTVIYALLPDFDGNLKKQDLEIASPYNTYKYRGLPPTPIANPGLASIKAALYPASSDYLYFVSMNNGRHKFSRTLEEHHQATSKYQLRR